jgi:hypothetical protein
MDLQDFIRTVQSQRTPRDHTLVDVINSVLAYDIRSPDIEKLTPSIQSQLRAAVTEYLKSEIRVSGAYRGYLIHPNIDQLCISKNVDFGNSDKSSCFVQWTYDANDFLRASKAALMLFDRVIFKDILEPFFAPSRWEPNTIDADGWSDVVVALKAYGVAYEMIKSKRLVPVWMSARSLHDENIENRARGFSEYIEGLLAAVKNPNLPIDERDRIANNTDGESLELASSIFAQHLPGTNVVLHREPKIGKQYHALLKKWVTQLPKHVETSGLVAEWISTGFSIDTKPFSYADAEAISKNEEIISRLKSIILNVSTPDIFEGGMRAQYEIERLR